MSLKNISISIAALLGIAAVTYLLLHRAAKDTGIIIADGGQGLVPNSANATATTQLALYTAAAGWTAAGTGTYTTKTPTGWDIDDDQPEALTNGDVFDSGQGYASVQDGTMTVSSCSKTDDTNTVSCPVNVTFDQLQITRKNKHKAKDKKFKLKAE